MSAPAMSPQLPLFDEEQLRAFAHLQSQAAWLYGGSQVGGFISTVPRPLSLEMEERDSMLRRLNLLQERLDQEQRDKVKFQKEVKDILEENRRLKEEVKFLEDPGRDVSFLQPLIESRSQSQRRLRDYQSRLQIQRRLTDP